MRATKHFNFSFGRTKLSVCVTVIAEKATKHMADNKIRKSPHIGRFIASSSFSMYLKGWKII
jgi:hypothetical protein